jgi:hypothetical protein
VVDCDSNAHHGILATKVCLHLLELVFDAVFATNALCIVPRCSGYDTEAIPYNYTDRPPTSTQIVKRNANILKRILKSFNSGADVFHVYCHSLTHSLTD